MKQETDYSDLEESRGAAAGWSLATVAGAGLAM